MSTLVAQTISNGTVSTSSANVIQGSAKAWVNFNGTGTVAIRASYNVSSITDNGTGDYTVNFTNALPNANYAVAVSAGSFTTTNGQGVLSVTQTSVTGGPTLKSTTQLRVLSSLGNGTVQDNSELNVTIFSS
jgi:hypothetical protein